MRPLIVILVFMASRFRRSGDLYTGGVFLVRQRVIRAVRICGVNLDAEPGSWSAMGRAREGERKKKTYVIEIVQSLVNSRSHKSKIPKGGMTLSRA